MQKANAEKKRLMAKNDCLARDGYSAADRSVLTLPGSKVTKRVLSEKGKRGGWVVYIEPAHV